MIHTIHIHNDTVNCVNMQVSYIIALFNEATEWVYNKRDLKAKEVVGLILNWLASLDCLSFAGQMFSFLHFSFFPPSFTAISRIPLSPIFRSQACNYVGLLVPARVCVHAFLEGGGWHRGCRQTCHFELVHQLPAGCLCHVHTHTHIHTQSWLFTDSSTKIYTHWHYK